ncbi:MAG: Holliday junction resolvase RecU [Lachnospiraceae bacterium]|nr:Holliday junction resolvase RecU [Lachnospiraceae bacterium]
MGYWKSRGLRGSVLEESINITNEKYAGDKLALIQKIPTPIKPTQINDKGQITLAYFEKKSTVDYIGAVQGIPVCFDAKECTKDKFSLQNIHEHQLEFMNAFEAQGGIAFFLIYFSKKDEYYHLRLEMVNDYFDKTKKGGKHYIAYEDLEKEFFIKTKKGIYVHYLETLQKDIELRDEN